jgi:hypothetical protein
MMKRYLHIGCVLLAGLYITACKKEVKSTDICLHDSSIDYLKRWGILTTQTDVFETNGAVKSRNITYPNGYFQINSDFTYNLFSDDAPVNGKWNINKSCDFVLNPNTAKERRFSVIQLSDDSLTLRQTSGLTSVTQRYTAFKCPSLASLGFRWDNAFTLQAPYSIDTVFKEIRSNQSGYFKLNINASYNLILGAFNGMPPPPQATGTWGIAQPGCLLVLDKNKTNERSYEVQKLTADSLVIWRKDTVVKQNFLQHFFKHK